MTRAADNSGLDSLESQFSLTALDRCDSCGAQAYIRVQLDSGELLFCAHHGRKFEPELKKIAAEIQDETERLTSVPASASEEER